MPFEGNPVSTPSPAYTGKVIDKIVEFGSSNSARIFKYQVEVLRKEGTTNVDIKKLIEDISGTSIRGISILGIP